MSKAQAIQKREKILEKMEESVKKNRIRNQCECLHTRKGDPDIIKANNAKNGELLYVCKQCEKEIRINRVPETTYVDEHSGKVVIGYRDAVKALDSMCDIIKMSLNLEKEKDEKLHDVMAEFQYRLRKDIVGLYKASLQNGGADQNNGRKKEKGHDRNNWNSPTTI